ncbi:hypothetical protein EDB19DRAFT_1979949 [Suillus lakei]|nr:hypothetical protein EDB19DRAFT_1979949 [Suillus lakei]
MTTLSSPLADVTSRNATADAVQLRAHTAEDLSALAQSMRVLRSRRNGLALTFGLPNEILPIIFKYFEEDERSNGYDSDNIPDVCRRWRKVALECSLLWTFISSSSSLLPGGMLERLKKAPLVVTYTIPIPIPSLLLPRTKYLEFCSLEWAVGHVMNLSSSRPAQMLESFKLLVRDSLLPTGIGRRLR